MAKDKVYLSLDANSNWYIIIHKVNYFLGLRVTSTIVSSSNPSDTIILQVSYTLKSKKNSIFNSKQERSKLQFLLSTSGIAKIAVAIVIVVAFSTVAGISYYATTQSPASNVSPTPSPVPTVSPMPTATPTPTSSVSPTPTFTSSPVGQTTQEQVRDSVMSFLRSNHPETAQFMTDLVWTGGRVTARNLVGAETYMYYSQGWNVTISYPVVPHAIYKIVADYSAIGIIIPYRIIWQGTWQNEVINETSYVFAK
jgi:hypothetical protein